MESPRLIIFVLLFSLSLPIFGYAFTQLSLTSVIPELALDREALISSGITISEGQSEVIEFNEAAVWTYYTIGNVTYRLAWYNPVLQFGIFHLQAQTHWADRILNTWFFPETQRWLDPSNNEQLAAFASGIDNNTVLTYFDEDKGWAWFINGRGLNVFFSYNATEATGIFDSIENNGNVTVTLATGSVWSKEMDFSGVIDWYFRLLIGDQSYGMPSELSWLIRIITAVMAVAAIWLAKDLLRL